MIVAIRAQYPAEGEYDWGESLENLASIGVIELAFHSPEAFVKFVDPIKVAESILDVGAISVPTIHMAHASLTNLGLFIPVLVGTLQIAMAIRCQNIVVHPNYGVVKDFEILYDRAILPLLDDYGCYFLWETFSSKRRILPAWEKLAAFCEKHVRSYICYDVVHMKRQTEEVIEDIDTYGHLIKGYHFSNWQSTPFKQHLPLGDGVLDFGQIVRHLVRTDSEASITLEYLPEFHDRLVPDAVRLLERVYK